MHEWLPGLMSVSFSLAAFGGRCRARQGGLKMALLDPGHPFFRPLWVRVAVVGLALVWSVVELVFGAPGWAMIFAAAGLYALWAFVRHRGADTPDRKD
jgi:hypothetical protein